MHVRAALLSLLMLPPVVGAETTLSHSGITFHIDERSSCFGFAENGRDIIRGDSKAGILADGEPVYLKMARSAPDSAWFEGSTKAGKHIGLRVTLGDQVAVLDVEVAELGTELRFQTSGASPAYGLADHAVYRAQYEHASGDEIFSTDVTGFADDSFLSGQGIARLVSNFIIYPRQQFAEILVDPGVKIVHSSATQIVQGVKQAPRKLSLYYFFGNPHQIYLAYLQTRRQLGYQVDMPKYQAFGVGWEAFGALAWDTDAKTVQSSVDRYLHEGYPLRWMVIGSGFWPDEPDTMHETTSFGMWNKKKYPEPRVLIQHFRDEGLAVMLGLRITFIVGGPYSDEGVRRGFFLKEEGKAKVYTGGWPKQPYYLLDAHDPAALDWYMTLVKKWKDFGINGWKEDFYGYDDLSLRDDKVDPTNDRLFAQGDLIIERNGYLSSNGDLHRINDFNFNQDQDRGPVNALALAYSGFPYVYPDIVGGTFGENHFKLERTSRMEAYMVRNAQWAALHASMGMGEPPWSFRKEVADVMLASAKLHERIAPYLYSNARKANEDGYPWTMTPLPIAFPDDPAVYGRENSVVRGYEWLIGDSILATPLYGNDYATANTRDVYLPEGRWMDYDTGEIYEGRKTLKAFPLPAGKTPIFIGGSGVTLETIDGETRICVYPIGRASTTRLTLPESAQVITINVPPIRSLEHVQVSSGDDQVTTRRERHSITFVAKPGVTYSVIGGR